MARKPMGLGVVGRPDITFVRKFRFTFSLQGFCGSEKNAIPEHFVKTAARPNISFGETQIDFLNGRDYIPGKATYEPITVTYLDVANDEMRPLYNWLATIYNYSDPINLTMGERRDWSSRGLLTMYDGCGTILSTWEMQNVWPNAVDWGDLDYAADDIAEISLTLRYSGVRFRSFCPEFTPESCCTPCGGPRIFA